MPKTHGTRGTRRLVRTNNLMPRSSADFGAFRDFGKRSRSNACLALLIATYVAISTGCAGEGVSATEELPIESTKQALAGYSLTFAGPTTLYVGKRVSVGWAAPSNHAANDWIGIFRVGASDNDFTAYNQVPGAQSSGELSLQLPFEVGEYELRYFVGGTGTLAAKTTELRLIHECETTATCDEYTISRGVPSAPVVGGTMRFAWTAPATHDEFDMVYLAHADATDVESALQGVRVGSANSGEVAFSIPGKGPFEARYWARTVTGGGAGSTALRPTADVSKTLPIYPRKSTDVGVSYDLTGFAPAIDGRIRVTWTAPATHAPSDVLGVFRPGARDRDWLTVSTTVGAANATTGEVSIQPPAYGAFEVRYIRSGPLGPMVAKSRVFHITAGGTVTSDLAAQSLTALEAAEAELATYGAESRQGLRCRLARIIEARGSIVGLALVESGASLAEVQSAASALSSWVQTVCSGAFASEQEHLRQLGDVFVAVNARLVAATILEHQADVVLTELAHLLNAFKSVCFANLEETSVQSIVAMTELEFGEQLERLAVGTCSGGAGGGGLGPGFEIGPWIGGSGYATCVRSAMQASVNKSLQGCGDPVAQPGEGEPDDERAQREAEDHAADEERAKGDARLGMALVAVGGLAIVSGAPLAAAVLIVVGTVHFIDSLIRYDQLRDERPRQSQLCPAVNTPGGPMTFSMPMPAGNPDPTGSMTIVDALRECHCQNNPLDALAPDPAGGSSCDAGKRANCLRLLGGDGVGVSPVELAQCRGLLKEDNQGELARRLERCMTISCPSMIGEDCGCFDIDEMPLTRPEVYRRRDCEMQCPEGTMPVGCHCEGTPTLVQPAIGASDAVNLVSNSSLIDIDLVGKLSKNGTPALGDFGSAVAISGSTAVLASSAAHPAGHGATSISVFARAGDTWLPQASLTASSAVAGDRFGSAVAVNGDLALVGASGTTLADTRSGNSYLFARSSPLASLAGYASATLVSGEAGSSQFSTSNAASVDSAPGGASWTEVAKLTAPEGATRFGAAVALDGDSAVIGAPGDGAAEAGPGSVFVFTRVGASWTQQAKLVASDAAAGDRFGVAVAMSGDTAVIGATGSSGAKPLTGAAYVFRRAGNGWSQQAKLAAANGNTGDAFGRAVALLGDMAVVGAPSHSGGGPLSGGAFVFRRSGTTWVQEAELAAADGVPEDRFGQSVALELDSATIGAPGVDGAERASGSAYVFMRASGGWVQHARLKPFDASPGSEMGASVAASGGTVFVGADDALGSAYVFSVCDPSRRSCEQGTGIASGQGGHHVCQRKSDGALWCWGYNSQGQLGDGTTSDRMKPVQVRSLGTTVSKASPGSAHTCAQRTDGTLWCWGSNTQGQLGDGTTSNRTGPVQVISLGNTVANVWSGNLHTCARKSDGTLWCWGNNAYGQLGDGTTSNRTSPVHVASLGTAVTDVAIGTWHTCARKSDGALWCWGSNGYGHLGDNTWVNRTQPVQVTALGSTVAEVSAGNGHTCARKWDGSLWCWGYNAQGQLGDGTSSVRALPTQVMALGVSVLQVSAGDFHTCARKGDGTVWCWGSNASGQLGDGTRTSRVVPVQVTAVGSDVVDVSCGSGHTCAQKKDGAVWCWGSNSVGQLGDGTSIGRATPGPIVAGPAAQAVPALRHPAFAALAAVLLGTAMLAARGGRRGTRRGGPAHRSSRAAFWVH